MNFSFKSLFAIWSLSPQRFHYYFFRSIVSWQYQKYSSILILVLCPLCVTPLVCSSYSSFALSWPFFSSWRQKDCEFFTYTLVLKCSPSTSSRQPQTTHVFADSRIALLCHVLRICVAHAPTEFVHFSCLYIKFFELVIEVIFHYCTTPPCHKIDLFKSPFRGSRSERLDDASLLLVSLIFLYPQKILISVRWSFELQDV